MGLRSLPIMVALLLHTRATGKTYITFVKKYNWATVRHTETVFCPTPTAWANRIDELTKDIPCVMFKHKGYVKAVDEDAECKGTEAQNTVLKKDKLESEKTALTWTKNALQVHAAMRGNSAEVDEVEKKITDKQKEIDALTSDPNLGHSASRVRSFLQDFDFDLDACEVTGYGTDGTNSEEQNLFDPEPRFFNLGEQKKNPKYLWAGNVKLDGKVQSIAEVVAKMRSCDWGENYNVLSHNCNYYTEALLESLGLKSLEKLRLRDPDSVMTKPDLAVTMFSKSLLARLPMDQPAAESTKKDRYNFKTEECVSKV